MTKTIEFLNSLKVQVEDIVKQHDYGYQSEVSSDRLRLSLIGKYSSMVVEVRELTSLGGEKAYKCSYEWLLVTDQYGRDIDYLRDVVVSEEKVILDIERELSKLEVEVDLSEVDLKDLNQNQDAYYFDHRENTFKRRGMAEMMVYLREEVQTDRKYDYVSVRTTGTKYSCLKTFLNNKNVLSQLHGKIALQGMVKKLIGSIEIKAGTVIVIHNGAENKAIVLRKTINGYVHVGSYDLSTTSNVSKWLNTLYVDITDSTTDELVVDGYGWVGMIERYLDENTIPYDYNQKGISISNCIQLTMSHTRYGYAYNLKLMNGRSESYHVQIKDVAEMKRFISQVRRYLLIDTTNIQTRAMIAKDALYPSAIVVEQGGERMMYELHFDVYDIYLSKSYTRDDRNYIESRQLMRVQEILDYDGPTVTQLIEADLQAK